MPRIVHPDAFQPFSEDEWGAVCQAASGITLYLGRGWSAKPDPDFAIQLVQFYGRTGIQPSLLGGIRPSAIRDGILTYKRTKTEIHRRDGSIGHMRFKNAVIPLHHEILPWAAEFLAKEKPAHRSTYNGMLNRIGGATRAETGADIHVNPLRFRHFAARTLLDLGVEPVVVCSMLRISLMTLQEHYGSLSPEAVKEKVQSVGW